MAFFARGEAGLLQRFRAGERPALEAVYRAYVDSVARAVSGALRRYSGEAWLGGWREVAGELPDLVQEVFTRAFDPDARLRFDGVRDYGPYLTKIARNVVVDFLRRRQRHFTRDPELLIDEIAIQGQAHDHAEDFADSQIVTLVTHYVACLPSDLRRVHEALYVQGLSQREAAAALGLGRQVVRTLASRLREGLENALRTVGHPELPAAVVVRTPALRPGKEKVR